MNTEKLISLKENFTGQKFQWVKTDRPELLGKVVKCRDIEPTNDGRFIAIFDDQSKVDTTKLNLNLIMIHGDMPPLSKEEVESINKPRGTKAPSPAAPARTEQPFIAGGQPSVNTSANKPNMFEMFNTEETKLGLTINVKLPDRKLLKLMYSSAEDKDKFLSQLAEYLQTMINKQVIKDSVSAILEPNQVPEKPKKSTINLKEVQ